VLWRHLDEFMPHNKHRIELVRIVVVVPLGLDMVAFGNNEHDELGNLQHQVLLVVVVKARITLLAE
jgi:hypothetical protein